jgi:hypothetical protein
MPSFATIFMFATLALSSFTSAAPLGSLPSAPAPVPAPADVSNTADAVINNAFGTVGDTVGSPVPPVSPPANAGAPVGLVVILTDATNTVSPIADQLSSSFPYHPHGTLLTVFSHVDGLKGGAVTVASVTSLTNQISTAIQTAIGSTKALQGQPLSVILASINGGPQLQISDVASLLGTLLTVRIFLSLLAPPNLIYFLFGIVSLFSRLWEVSLAKLATMATLMSLFPSSQLLGSSLCILDNNDKCLTYHIQWAFVFPVDIGDRSRGQHATSCSPPPGWQHHLDRYQLGPHEPPQYHQRLSEPL